MEYEVTTYEKKDRIARITLNRPAKLNAVIPRMMEEILAAMADARQDDNVRVLIFTGAGRGFCSGDDVEHLRKIMADEGGKPSLPGAAGPLPTALRVFEKPTIAMVNGSAIGMGCDLALMCDFIVASEKASFGELYIQRGVVPSAGNWLLPRMVGVKKAAQILMLGDIFDAREAERIGLTYKVVPPELLEAETMQLANRLANIAPVALRFTKYAIIHGLEWNLETTLGYVSYARSAAAKVGEAVEGVVAFREKRAARF